MAWLYHFNQIVTHGMEGFLETAVPLISGLAEIIGLFIIVTSLVKATFALRAMMSLMLHWEMEGGHRSGRKKEETPAGEAEKKE